MFDIIDWFETFLPELFDIRGISISSIYIYRYFGHNPFFFNFFTVFVSIARFQENLSETN